jgi:hypothetical protein
MGNGQWGRLDSRHIYGATKMRNECLDAAREALREAGVHDHTVARGGKHLQVQWFYAGRPRVYVLPATASDVRAVANTRAGVRRILREDGLLQEVVEEKPKPRPLSLEQRVARLETRLGMLAEKLERAAV